MLFDQACELPVATVRRAPRARLDLLAADLERWLAARWRWWKPRTVPVLVAFVGMLGVLQAVSYLSHPPQAGAPPPGVQGSPDRVHLVLRSP